MSTILALLAILSTTVGGPRQIGTFKARPASVTLTVLDPVTEQPTDQKITITATAEYTVWPERVFCLSRTLFVGVRPKCPVRLVLLCKSRYSAGYWFGTDNSYTDKTGKHWVKVYDVDALKRTPGKYYIVDADEPTAKGQIKLTAIQEVTTPVKITTTPAPLSTIFATPTWNPLAAPAPPMPPFTMK